MNLDRLRAALCRRFFVSALMSLMALGASQAAMAQNAVNTATIAPPAGVEDPAGGCSGSPVVCTGNNTATDSDPIVRPQLTLTKTHSGDFTVGADGVYTLTLSNTSVAPGGAPTTGAITVVDSLPAGLSFVSAVGAGWTCGAAGQDVTCTTNAVIDPGSAAPPITLTVAVDAAAVPSVTNTARASGGGDSTCPASGATQARCNPSDPTTVRLAPAVTVTKSSNPVSGTTVAPGDTIEYTLTVNVANTATSGEVVLTDTLTGAQTFTGTATLPANASCAPSGNTMVCRLGAGATPVGGPYTFIYSTTVNPEATGSIGNNVLPSGPDNPTCVGTCDTTHAITPVQISTSKTSAAPSPVTPGDTITYMVTTVVSNSATTADYLLTDTLSTGLAFGSVTGATASTASPSFTCSGTLSCTLPQGALPGTYTVTYTATVEPGATGTLNNQVAGSGGGDPDPECTPCRVEHPVTPTGVSVAKSSNPASGTAVSPGSTVTYTLTVIVANSATTGAVTLTDTLSAGQTLGAMPAGCTVAGQVVTCVLGANALPNTYTFAYTATVDPDATGSISNVVVPSGTDNPTCAPGACQTEHPIVPAAVTVKKSSDPANGTTVNPGDTIAYTLTVNVANSITTGDVTLTDTLSAGQTLGAMPAGCTVSGQVVTCVLAAGALPNIYTFAYTATVNADTTGSISNVVVPSGTDNPTCAPGACQTEHPIAASRITVVKSSDPASGAAVNAGDTITYTVTVSVANSATVSPVVLDDTFSGGHGLTGTPTVPAGGACTVTANGLQCTLAAGSLPGDYAFVYQTVVAATAAGSVGNQVVATGGGTDDPDCTSCSTQHPLAAPVVQVSKASTPGNGAAVNIGDTIQYTLTVDVANAATTLPVTLTDTPGAALTVGALPAGCAINGGNIECALPAGSVPGSYTFVYPATVNADANGNVANVVAASGGSIGTNAQPRCLSCNTAHPVADAAQLRIVKQASPRNVKIGDLVRYTLTIENVGAANVSDFSLIDTPPAGFSYVAGSLAVADADGLGGLAGTHPAIRVDRLDVRAGEQARVQYLLRVGAGVRPGTHVNRARAEDGGSIVSNEATAEVQLAADPLLDESLLIGTVFDDRDGDGWQDRASLSGVHVQGGFATGAYVAGSTTLDRGHGPVPQADASAPLLHGMDIGEIAGRQSEAEPLDAHTVVIGQTLNALDFTDSFVLTSKQGVTVRMDAAGNTRTERSGKAADNLTSADPKVERRVSQVDGGYRVDYVIRNAGIDERGIPGVRLASVEGLLIETDQFGRYHLEGVAGGPWERGRNFILKADPATLPPGSVFTGDNPLVRRLTPGLPVRFDFPVKLPPGLVEGGRRQVEMELAEVVFAAGSAQVRDEYAAVIDKIAEQVRQHEGGQVVISANGESQVLTYERALAVRTALLDKLTPEQAKTLEVALRTDVGDPGSALLTLGESAVLGTFLFDTDKAAIKPEYSVLLNKLAADIQSRNGGVIAVVGHADRRGSDAYNAALGLRRAKAVFDAIAARLTPEARAKLRVDISENPAAPAGTRGQ